MSDSPGEERRDGATAEPDRADREDRSTQATDAHGAQDHEETGEQSSEERSGRRRRRGSRGGRNRNRRPADNQSNGDGSSDATADTDAGSDHTGDEKVSATAPGPRKPKIGDSRPAPPSPAAKQHEGSDKDGKDASGSDGSGGSSRRRRRRRGGRGRGRGGSGGGGGGGGGGGSGQQQKSRQSRPQHAPVEALMADSPLELDDDELERRRGAERKGKPVGRYLMAVNVGEHATQISVLEGRNLVEHYVSRPADDVFEIHGNIYLARVQNVLPGMEAAFIDIGTPKNAVLYRGDVVYDTDDVEKRDPRIEHLLKPRQTILCQVTKNPIAHKGARLTQEVSLPGRFVVLVPNSRTFGISKRLPDKERKRLRQILDRSKPAEHGVIVRTAAEGVTSEEIEADVRRLVAQWKQIEELAKKSKAPQLLYREPELAVRVIREEFNKDYRKVVIDDRELHDSVAGYVASITPALAERVEHYDTEREKLPLLERYHVHEQLVKALDKKVWLPSGGSLIIEQTEALTVIDVNTGKNVGSSNLEETVTRNNVEAAEEVAKQLRLRDIGGIIVIDFVDMEDRRNRDQVMKAFRGALARDKTRTQVFDISELGLVEMTRKRIGEGLVESYSKTCPTCEGRGLILQQELLDDVKHGH